MRKHLLVIAFALTTSFLQAQIVNIPDVKFKAILLNHPNVNTNKDSEIQETETKALTYLSVSKASITDLTGIEAFTSLEYLECNNNQLTKLDLSKNASLKEIHCINNELKTLIVSNNPELKILRCQNNQIETLELSNSPYLTGLYCEYNRLTELNISKNVKLNYLYCADNLIRALDISNNIELTDFECISNKLTSLDVSKNIKLTYLGCDSNQIASLDISQNVYLNELWCSTNKITSLDISRNSILVFLVCHANNLTSLDVSMNNTLDALICSFNTNLTTICINSVQKSKTISKPNYWSKDATAQWSTTCGTVTAIEDRLNEVIPKTLMRILTSLGQEIREEQATDGLFIYQYSDGSTRKIAK